MKIGTKILLVVLPLLIAPILIGGVSSSLSARNAVTSIAQESLQFKAEELYRYANSQWRILVENDLTEKPEYISITKDSVASYAEGLIRSSTELLAAVTKDGTLEFSTLPVNLSTREKNVLSSLFSSNSQGWTQLEIGGTRRVGQLVWFEPFQWMFLVTEEEQTFYSVVEDIYRRTGIILLTTLVIAIILVFVFTRTLLRPLDSMNTVISDIITSGDLSRRVPLLYRDEIGDLGHRFNIMTEELEKAYGQIKRYA
ncbi:MAG: HAMP domain-containing protein, partial [Sediminispirochaetaceae bacterium]